MKRLITLALAFSSIYLFGQNPQLLKDVFPGNNSGTIQNIVKTTGYTFFNEDDDDADADRSLFRTDGTNAGTIKLNLTYPGYISTKAEMLTPLGNKVVFAGDNFPGYGEIWASDGTQAGTVAIERFQPVNSKVPVVELKTMGSYTYYSVINKDAGNINRAYLRRTDGTAAGTSLVYDFSAFTGVPQVGLLTPVNNILYFIVYDIDGTGVDQLWRSDGTTAGTYMVYDFTTANFVESFIMPAGNTMYLMIGSVVGGVRQNTIWKSDGTTAGTVPVKLVGTGNTNIYPPFAAIGSTLYFAGVDGNGKELWQTDGSAAGTFMVADINPGAGSSNPSSFAVLNNTLFFSAATPTSGGELWKYSSGVASLVKDINPGAANSGPGQLTVSGNTILFNANNGTNGGELWITDGTSRNTVMVADINPSGNSIPNTFTGGNPVYFAANNGINGFEVFKYDNNGDVLSGPRKYYVNDNSLSGDLLTLGIGNNNNNGSKAYPFATINYAVTQVQEGDTIYVDAGTYVEQVTLDKGVTIIGAGQNFTSILKPATINPPPGPFTEPGVIQTAQNIGDVHLKDISVTGDPAGVVPVLIQGGGSVKNCKLLNGNQGLFVRVDPGTTPSAKTFVLENSILTAEFIGANIEGTNLTATLLNNSISASNVGFSAGLFVGADFGPLGNFTATGNVIAGYSTYGLLFNAAASNISQNSIVGVNGVAIQNNGGTTINATCNWYGASDQYIVASKISGSVNFSPWLVNGTDNDLATMGFQPAPGSCSGKQLFYVNDNSLTGDIFTSAIGNNANNGSPSAPLATIANALSRAQAGDMIFVDAGNYIEQVNINKAITIKGAGKTLTFINGPAAPIAELPDWPEKGIIQSRAGIGDVIIEDILVDGTNSDEQHAIMIQGGGRVSNCEIRNANNGFFFRHISTQPRNAIGNNNYIHNISFVGILFAGNGLSAEAYNNVIDLNGAVYGMGFISGWGGDGNLASFTATNNSIVNFNGFGMMVGSIQPAQIHNNSITRINGSYFINTNSGVTIDATCNWWGTTDAALIIPYMDPAVTYSPWLSNGTDNDVAMGFQPLPNVCNGRQNKFYVNDASQTGDVFTTAVGNDANTGIPSAPLLTINAALTKATAGDTIYVDAGTYNLAAPLTINKSITILGSNYTTSPNDNANKYLVNSSRNADAKITGAAFVIGADYINFKGLRFSPSSSAISQNGNFNHIKIEKTFFDVTGTGNTVNFQGSSANPIVAFDFSVTDSRFERTDLLGGNSINLGLVKSIWIDNNVFIEAPVSGNPFRGFAVRTVFTQSVESTVFSNNYVKKLQAGVLPTMIQDWTINNNVFDSCNTGINHAPANTVSNNIFIRSNTFTNTRVGRSILVRGGTNGGINNLSIIDNTLNQEVDGINGVVGMIQLDFAASSNNGTATISGNRLNLSGNYDNAFFKTQCGIILMGKHNNTTVSDNELTFTAINAPFNPSTFIPPIPTGIFINTDGGTGSGPIPAGSIITITNNKINGFKSSIGLYDPTSTGLTPMVGYGYLTNGATVNINNNSFTGDSISITNGTTSQPVNASCNWYGSAAAQDFINKLSLSTVDIVPWLTNGTDNSPATGFQPVSGACDGYPTLITLDNYTNVTCNGAANGAININVSYGKAPFTYTWTKDGDENFVSHAEDPNGLAPGTYHLSITDGNGSNIYITDPEGDGPGTIDVTITEPSVLTADASGSNVSCYSGNNGTASVTAGGGTTPYSYSWSNGGTTASIGNLTAGTYTVTVTDGNGCTKTASYQVTQPAQLTAVATGTSTSCANSATVVANGGTSPYSYSWSNGASTQSITSLPAGTYTVTVTDGNGCQTTASCTVTASEAFNPSASVTNVSCFGGNNGSITVTNANAVAPFQFSLDGVNFTSPQALPYTFNNLTAGTYTVYVRDANGCTGFVNKTITQPPVLTVTLGTVQTTCFGQSTGSIAVTVTGGTGSLTYSWTGPLGYTSTQKNISGLAAGNYQLIVTDANGCTKNLTATVPTFAQINVNSTVTNIACKGELNGSISVAVTGGTGSGFSYLWNTGSTANAISNLGVGNYNVTITDIGSGCVVTRSYTITQPATNVNISTTKTMATGCNSLGTITATGSGGTAPYTYSLNGSPYQSSGSFVGLFAGNYTVTVKDANGCTKASAVIGITDSGSDEFEGNNSKNQAKQISLSATNLARLATATDVADWFKFTTTSAGNYTFTLTHPSASFTYNVYRSGNNTPALPTSGSTATSKTYVLGADSTYYISVTGGLSYVCYQFSIAPASFLTKSSGSNIQPEVTKTKPEINFNAKAYPNPSNHSFTIKIESSSDETMNLRVMDASGRLIEERKNIAASQIIKLGERYINGVYLVEIMQGNNHKTIRLIKM